MLSAAFLAGIGVGWALAALGPDAPHELGNSEFSDAPAAENVEKIDKASGADISLPATVWDLASRSSALEALLDELEAERASIRKLAQRAVAASSDSNLASVLMSTTQLSYDEIGEIRDIRGFAERMLDVAMQGITEEASETAATENVRFSLNGSVDLSTTRADARFPSSAGRIYATFPTPDSTRRRILVKWSQRDRPRILLMRRYSLDPLDDVGFVWLDPDGSWAVGSYQVEVYAADEDVTPLAAGRYEIW